MSVPTRFIHGLESVLEAASERPISMAVERRTAATLRSSGVEPLVPAREDSEGLLALPQLQVVAQRRIVLVKGPGGRELIADTLRERGAEVIEFNCYRRQYIPVAAAIDCLANRAAEAVGVGGRQRWSGRASGKAACAKRVP
jgi:uroporphyrinogen-III synthase